MAKHTLSYFGENFEVRDFFDPETSTSGLDVIKENGEHIGEIWSESIPDWNDATSSVGEFNKLIEDWLEENYL